MNGTINPTDWGTIKNELLKQGGVTSYNEMSARYYVRFDQDENMLVQGVATAPLDVKAVYFPSMTARRAAVAKAVDAVQEGE